MKRVIVLLTAISMICLTSVKASAGDIINLQFGTGGYAYDNGAAINDVAGQTWNLIEEYDGSIANLQYSDAVDSGVSVVAHMGGDFGLAKGVTTFPEDSIDENLILGGLFTANNGTINFSNLNAGTYKVYVYSQDASGLLAQITMNAVTSIDSYNYTLSNDSHLTELTPGATGNYLMRVVEVGDGTLFMNFGQNNKINGIQIEAVPEPGGVVLLGIGGIIVLGRLKQKSNDGFQSYTLT